MNSRNMFMAGFWTMTVLVLQNQSLKAADNSHLIDFSKIKESLEFTNKLEKSSSPHDLLYYKNGTIYKVLKEGEGELFFQANELTLITKGRLKPFSLPEDLSNPSEYWPSPNMDALVFYAPAFAIRRKNQPVIMQGLFIHEFSSGTTVSLVPYEGLFQTPVFSPDGSKIAFYFSRNEDKTGRGGDWALHVINRDGTNRKEIAPPSVRPSENSFRVEWDREISESPIWSPDGEVIYFRANYGSGLSNYKVFLSNGTYKKLGGGIISSISPDGKQLHGTYGYLIIKDDKVFKVGDKMVCVWDTTGQNRKLLTRGGFPSFSPDGELISFWRGDSLFTIDSGGGSEKFRAVVPKKFTYPIKAANVIWGNSIKVNTNQPIPLFRTEISTDH